MMMMEASAGYIYIYGVEDSTVVNAMRVRGRTKSQRFESR